MERISDCGIEVLVSEEGAELRSIRKDGVEYLWQGDEAHWKRHAPLLFPFVGRLNERRYTYKGISYDMTPHGFAPASLFSVVSNSGSAVRLSLSSNEETKKIYPFDFSLSVTYSVSGSTVSELVEVENTGNDEMFYGIGFHPGFNVPIEQGLGIEDYKITFPLSSDPEKRVFAPDRLEAGYNEKAAEFDGNAIPLSHDIFSDDAIVLSGTGSKAIISSAKGSRSVELHYDAPWMGIWQTFAPDTPFVCLEPWYSLPGRTGVIVDISKRDDFIRLMPSEKRTHGIEIIIG